VPLQIQNKLNFSIDDSFLITFSQICGREILLNLSLRYCSLSFEVSWLLYKNGRAGPLSKHFLPRKPTILHFVDIESYGSLESQTHIFDIGKFSSVLVIIFVSQIF